MLATLQNHHLTQWQQLLQADSIPKSFRTVLCIVNSAACLVWELEGLASSQCFPSWCTPLVHLAQKLCGIRGATATKFKHLLASHKKAVMKQTCRASKLCAPVCRSTKVPAVCWKNRSLRPSCCVFWNSSRNCHCSISCFECTIIATEVCTSISTKSVQQPMCCIHGWAMAAWPCIYCSNMWHKTCIILPWKAQHKWHLLCTPHETLAPRFQWRMLWSGATALQCPAHSGYIRPFYPKQICQIST